MSEWLGGRKEELNLSRVAGGIVGEVGEASGRRHSVVQTAASSRIEDRVVCARDSRVLATRVAVTLTHTPGNKQQHLHEVLLQL